MTRTRLKLGEWAEIDEQCKHYSDNGTSERCGRMATHAIFLNLPEDKPYVVSACRKHAMEGGFSYVTLGKFTKVVEQLMDLGITEKRDALALAVMDELDPIAELEKQKGRDE